MDEDLSTLRESIRQLRDRKESTIEEINHWKRRGDMSKVNALRSKLKQQQALLAALEKREKKWWDSRRGLREGWRVRYLRRVRLVVFELVVGIAVVILLWAALTVAYMLASTPVEASLLYNSPVEEFWVATHLNPLIAIVGWIPTRIFLLSRYDTFVLIRALVRLGDLGGVRNFLCNER